MSTARKVPPIAIKGQHRKDDELECWICERLALRDLFAGVTDKQTRAARLKVVLIERGLIESIAGRFEGKSISWHALYSKLYNDELTTTGENPC